MPRKAPPPDPEELLDLRGAATLLGVKTRSVTMYRTLYKGTPTPFPDPDLTAGRSPLWKRHRIEAWDAARPGRTGRPRKAQPAPVADAEGPAAG